MAKFLSRSEIYRIIQRELPPNAYPDGSPSAYFATADSDATAAVFASLYSNLQRIYDNYWPQYADEKLPDWEITVFGKNQDASLSIQERRDRLIERIRTRRRTTPSDIRAVVASVIGTDKFFEVVEWGCGGWGWILDVSLLDISTILNTVNRLERTGPDLCGKDAAWFGLTEEEFVAMQEEAYTYEVRVYGYTLTPEERIALDEALTESEPARSRHIIADGLDPEDALSGEN